MQSDLELKNNEWNFDFNKEKPIGDKFFVWETVSANRAPKFYSKTPTKKNCNPNRSLRRKRRSYTSPGRDEAPKKPKIHMDNHHPVKSTKSRGNENIKQRSKNKKKEPDQNQKLISQYFRNDFIKNDLERYLVAETFKFYKIDKEPNLDMLVKLLTSP